MGYGRGYPVTYLLIFDMATLKVSNLDKFRKVFSEHSSPQNKKKITIQNPSKGTKTLHLSYDGGYLVTYSLIFDIWPLSG